MHNGRLKKHLESLHRRYNRADLIHPDPLEFLSEYGNPTDREVVALIASSLAYGRVAQILKSVRIVLDYLGSSPAGFVRNTPAGEMKRHLRSFKHRFATGKHIGSLLAGAGIALRDHGSLEKCFLSGSSAGMKTVVPALDGFVTELSRGGDCGHLLPDPGKGSACKRLNLFFRWVVRNDAVDPGGWKGVSSAQLIIPLDTHMHRIGTALGFTSRKQANMKTALEITDGFRRICPKDPVKYDFALTRLGIRRDADINEFLEALGCPISAT